MCYVCSLSPVRRPCVIYMLLNSLTMVGAILIEICTSAPYRPGHWLLIDVTPEPHFAFIATHTEYVRSFQLCTFVVFS